MVAMYRRGALAFIGANRINEKEVEDAAEAALNQVKDEKRSAPKRCANPAYRAWVIAGYPPEFSFRGRKYYPLDFCEK